jgi:hypothetical protein
MYGLVFNTGGETPDSSLSIHWVMGEATEEALNKYILSFGPPTSERRAKMAGIRRVAGVRVKLFRFPDYPAGGMFGGHIVAVVSRGGEFYFASVHGYEHADASAAMAVALEYQAAGR